MIKRIDRYIAAELIDPFLFGLFSFTLILTSSMVLFELVRAVVLGGMSLIVALQIFLYRLPGVIVYIFPMAMLLAALLAFSRLSHDSEIIAFRAAGITLHRLVVPVILMGFVISLINLAFYEIVVPQANKEAKKLLVVSKTQYKPRLQENIFLPEIENGQLKRIFYARRMQESSLEGVIIQDFTDGKLSQIVNAKTGQWQKDKGSWLFQNGIIYILAESGEYKHLLKFKEQNLTIKYSPTDFAAGEKNPEEMNIAELKKYIELKEKMGIKTTDYKLQLNLKIAIPFACLVFALLGAPLGISPRRASASLGLGLSIIVIFIYYILMFFSMAVGELEWVSPGLAAWIPNFITGGMGWYILNQKAKS